MTRNYKSAVQEMQVSTKKLREDLNKVGQSVRGFGGLYSLGISAPMATAYALSIKAAASVEDMMASLKTVTGSKTAADSAFGQISKFATETPYQLTEVLDAYIKLKALGLDPSTESIRSFGNTASAMNKPLMQMIEAVADASTLEFERLKEFGIRAQQQGKYVTFTFQGVKTKVKKDAAAIQAYLKSIGDVNFAGAMAEKMDNFNGLLSNFEDTVASSMNTSGQQIIQSLDLKDLVRKVTSTIQGLTDAFMALPVGMRNFVVIAGLVLMVLGPVLIGIGQLVIGIGGLIMGFTYIAPAIMLALGALKALSIGLLTTPIGWFVLGVAAIAGAAYLIYRNWSGLSAWFQNLWSTVKIVFSSAVASILTFLSPLLTAIETILSGAGKLGSIVRGGMIRFGQALGPSASPVSPASPVAGGKSAVDMGGTLKIKIDSAGQANVVQAEPNDNRMGYSVDSGLVME